MEAKELYKQLEAWQLAAATLRSNRPWCNFGISLPSSHEELMGFFDRGDIEALYKERFEEKEAQKRLAYSFLQIDNHLIYGVQKAFTQRHKHRLDFYRDDASQKAYHARRAVAQAFSRLEFLKNKAEAEGINNA